MKQDEFEELRRKAKILHQKLRGNLVKDNYGAEVAFIADAFRELLEEERAQKAVE